MVASGPCLPREPSAQRSSVPYLTVQGREPAPLGHFLEPLPHLSLRAGLAQFSTPQEAPHALTLAPRPGGHHAP